MNIHEILAKEAFEDELIERSIIRQWMGKIVEPDDSQEMTNRYRERVAMLNAKRSRP